MKILTVCCQAIRTIFAVCLTSVVFINQASAAGIANITGTVAYINNEQSDHLVDDLGLDLMNISIGQSFDASYNIDPNASRSTIQGNSEFTQYFILSNYLIPTDPPDFSLNLEIGPYTFSRYSWGALTLGDNVDSPPNPPGSDFYIFGSRIFIGPGYDLWMYVSLVDHDGDKLDGDELSDPPIDFYVEGSLVGWEEAHFTIAKIIPGVDPEVLLSSLDYSTGEPPVDSDVDGVPDDSDNCPTDFNPSQLDQDSDGIGDACDTDADNDGVPDDSDNCPNDSNSNQSDQDNDGIGDACDTDADNDGVEDGNDNCPATPSGSSVDANGCSQSQVDEDGDGVCDPGESSTLCAGSDNCPVDANPGQVDNDYDDLGNVCDTCPNDPGSCDVFAGVIFDKAEVKFNYGKIKIYGSLTVPPGYWTDNLSPSGSAQLLVAGVDVANQSTNFEVKGSDNKKWEFEAADNYEYGVKKFKVDFKGAKYDYHHSNGVKLKTRFIGGEETNIEIEVKEENWPTTIMIADQTISYDASGNITTSVPYELYKEGDTSKAFFALPMQLLAGDSILIGSDPVYVGDDYKEGTVKFKLEASFDESQPPYADAVDKTLEFNVSLGGALYAIGTIDTADWDEIKDDKWKK